MAGDKVGSSKLKGASAENVSVLSLQHVRQTLDNKLLVVAVLRVAHRTVSEEKMVTYRDYGTGAKHRSFTERRRKEGGQVRYSWTDVAPFDDPWAEIHVSFGREKAVGRASFERGETVATTLMDLSSLKLKDRSPLEIKLLNAQSKKAKAYAEGHGPSVPDETKRLAKEALNEHKLLSFGPTSDEIASAMEGFDLPRSGEHLTLDCKKGWAEGLHKLKVGLNEFLRTWWPENPDKDARLDPFAVYDALATHPAILQRLKQEAERRNGTSGLFDYVVAYPQSLDRLLVHGKNAVGCRAWLTWDASPGGERAKTERPSAKDIYLSPGAEKYRDLLFGGQ
ncbi:hypothetical protein ACQKM2_01580 [Streptomyces sp. NPDC004126]|uniref:hypothetical protein n=1 Tax=Streptomyces sp. NPDC004126 TaxID=3390695 RepID=UPI003D03AAE3